MTQDNLKAEIEKIIVLYQDLILENDKQKIIDSHVIAKFSIDSKGLQEAIEKFNIYKSFFIEPSSLDINKISPKLINVNEGKIWKSLFNIVRRTWSMPFNKGYGRRLRYIVFDEYHEAVIGIIGLQSPPADLSCRDQLFNYVKDKKLDLVNQTMDIYSLGSIPPYSGLLGGKLVAGLAGSKTIVDDYNKKYAGKETLINQKILDNSLVALTTTSAFGRSSIYNRLKFHDRLIAEPIGYTKGFGNLHLEPVYPEIIKLLKEHNLFHAGGYANGPKQRWQNINRALTILKLPSRYAKHGLLREVFLYRLRSDLESGMSGGEFGELLAHCEQEYSNYWLDRWALPRAKRYQNWKETQTHEYIVRCLSRANSSQ